MTDVLNGTQVFRDSLKTFIIDNGIIGTMAGVSIGIVTKDLISSLVGDIIIPVIIILLLKLNVKSLTNILPGNSRSSLNITNFIRQFVSWALVIVITFVFVKGAVERLLGINSSKKPEGKTKESFL
jgi:large-conductance mechanosensitive channel